jgi:predicted GIY-YIG superfamily endonuclease
VHYVYILQCVDGSYYVGSTCDLEHRLAAHQTGTYGGYTSTRLPVQLLWSAEFTTEHEAFLIERQLKGWSRVKKETLIRDGIDGVHEIVKHERQTREAAKRESKKAS